ncbi:SH3 domain-containing protein [Roseospirillum parvum]|uniref:SH3-like domain-containing protein n=1 Tax=Roseospirillum parvum TaxID=83401 RepID=A0A1G7Z631_9PROT|nr:SH3 domain-containing protein [Roseospirillum parvum]SDH04144.1 SH3-like domain-containing protein [Roseospirillum parvum]
MPRHRSLAGTSFSLIAALLLLAPQTQAQEQVQAQENGAEAASEAPRESGVSTGLPLPRFASLRSDKVNLRRGPGVRYPVDWVYLKRDLPVEVIGEFDTWRKIRDPEGTEGWVHQSMLSGRRTLIVTGGEPVDLTAEADPDSPPRAHVEPGVLGHLLTCQANARTCRAEINDLTGFLPRDRLWGIHRGEQVD